MVSTVVCFVFCRNAASSRIRLQQASLVDDSNYFLYTDIVHQQENEEEGESSSLVEVTESDPSLLWLEEDLQRQEL